MATRRTLLVQSYYVHSDNYALRIRLKTRRTRIPMDRSTDPLEVLDRCRDLFSQAFVTIKGPAVGGTRYEAEREIDTRIGRRTRQARRRYHHQEPLLRVDR